MTTVRLYWVTSLQHIALAYSKNKGVCIQFVKDNDEKYSHLSIKEGLFIESDDGLYFKLDDAYAQHQMLCNPTSDPATFAINATKAKLPASDRKILFGTEKI
jgi:hypothetical protein